MTSRVTVIIPTRDRPDYLRISLLSVLTSVAEAARVGIETRVLVVDDASVTDSTRDVALDLGVDYHRIDVHDGRNNPASAIALGVGLVTSEFLSVFGDDDLMLPRFIVGHVEALEKGFDVCATAFVQTDAELRAQREVVLPEANLGDLLVGRITVNDGAMTRAALVQQLTWDPAMDQEIFYPIWLELLYRGARFTKLDEPTFLYRRHSANVSDQLDERDVEQRRGIRERYVALVVARDGAIPLPTPRPNPTERAPRPASPPRRLLRRMRAAARIQRPL